MTRLSDAGSLTATSLGTLNTVRITARINGRASQLQTNLPAVLELSSTPSRSTTELLALMGGGSIADLNQVGEKRRWPVLPDQLFSTTYRH